ncbi:hypothetical protein RJ639_002122 [Escallonia herrerae]|uniref:Uncharacterized protein n=1 Tax=Escallonia herrerae TaxID=1293975 RepID=A0AA89BJK1_9ASTE|nr:hypothetical protein RJ639_002122 [Escallonia herrerae]
MSKEKLNVLRVAREEENPHELPFEIEARAGITAVYILPFNPMEKRTAITYIDSNGNWHTSSCKVYLIIDLCKLKWDTRKRAHEIINNFANRGLRSLTVPEKTKKSAGSPWEFVSLLPLFDPPRHDSAETICKAHDLGVNGKMITGDQLAIGKETGRRLGMGTNMYPFSFLLGQSKEESIASTLVDELIKKAEGFAGIFPGDGGVRMPRALKEGQLRRGDQVAEADKGRKAPWLRPRLHGMVGQVTGEEEMGRGKGRGKGREGGEGGSGLRPRGMKGAEAEKGRGKGKEEKKIRKKRGGATHAGAAEEDGRSGGGKEGISGWGQ